MKFIIRKYFSDNKKNVKENEKQPTDIRALKAVGKVGLEAGAGLGAISLGLGAHSAYHGARVAKDLSELKKLKDSQPLRNEIKGAIREGTKYIPKPGLSEDIIDKVRWGEKNFPKFSKIDKMNRGLNYWNKSSKLSRTMLNNIDKYSKMGIDSIKEKHGNRLTEDEAKLLDKVPGVVKRVGKMGTSLKNAKAFGKAGLIAGQAGGLLYINGRALESGANKPVK